MKLEELEMNPSFELIKQSSAEITSGSRAIFLVIILFSETGLSFEITGATHILTF